MRTAWISVPATRLWRTCSRSRGFHGSIFADKAASTKWSGPPFVLAGARPSAVVESCPPAEPPSFAGCCQCGFEVMND